MPNTITVIVADDHHLFRRGLQYTLTENERLHLIAEASDGLELCNLVKKFRPQIVITDVSMPVMNGIEATKHIKQHFPQTGVIALSIHEEIPIIKEMLSAGANAFLLKTAEIKEINEAIYSVQKGDFYVSNGTSKFMSNILQYSVDDCFLTKREKEIIQLLFEEHTSNEISDKLYLSKRTVEEHRKNIQKKTGAKNVIGIIKYALKKKIVQFK